jgi:hypothetical protein
MKTYIISVVAALLASAVHAEEADWVLIGENAKGAYGINPISIRRMARARYQFWIKETPKTIQNGVTERKFLYGTDCENSTVSVLAYAEYNRSGMVVSSGDIPSYQVTWDAIIPESIGETANKVVCAVAASPDWQRTHP